MRAAGSPLRVLVVDDDPVMREVLEALLSMAGHDVQTAESGEQALGMLAADSAVDVALTDLNMPGGLEGRALGEKLAATRSAQTLLIAMSGSQPQASELEPFDGFIYKPFQNDGFESAVEEARRKSSVHAASSKLEEPASHTGAVDEKIFTSLRATLPAAQLRELYDLTLRDIHERLDRMQAAMAAGDADQLKREAHAIKGACGMVGAAELRELAAAIEGGSPECTPLLAEFPAACERLERILNTRLSDSQGIQTRRA